MIINTQFYQLMIKYYKIEPGSIYIITKFMFGNNSNRELLIDSDQQTECSFDSSQVYSLATRTASIDSRSNSQLPQIIIRTPIRKRPLIDQIQSERTVSIQRPRVEMSKLQAVFQRQDFSHASFQLGFVRGRNKKNIDFNQSKMKEVDNFFNVFNKEQTPSNYNDNFYHSMMQFPKQVPDTQFVEQIPQFSHPCFKNMGKNKQVTISKDYLQKARNFFNDGSQKPLSFKKPTKVKNLNQTSHNQQNFTKTVNLPKTRHSRTPQKIQKKQVFNWQRFQQSSKKLFNTTQSTSPNKTPQPTFPSIKLKDLNEHALLDVKMNEQFLRKRDQFESLSFCHQKAVCHIFKCLLCHLGIQREQFGRVELEGVFRDRLEVQGIAGDKFRSIFQMVCFMLLKYDTFWHYIVNRRLNPSNILVQLHRRAKVIQNGLPYLGWLQHCINENKFYSSFVVQVRQVYFNHKIRTFFIQISDSWTNAWAIITQKNALYNYIPKLTIFSKLFIGYWKHYPLANILSFCPNSRTGQKCIEIYYNSSIIVKKWSKIGKPKNMIFYRELNRNRKNGGMVPTVEGTVVRMICIPSTNKKSTNLHNQNTFADNFLEIITPEGYTTLIKHILPTDKSLAQVFRLYYTYQFYFLKIGCKDNMLQFNNQYSKLYELQKKQKNCYDPQLIRLLRTRFINSMPLQTNLLQTLKIGNHYDIKLQNRPQPLSPTPNSFILQANPTTPTPNCFPKPTAPTLHQQYILDRVQTDPLTKDNPKCVRFYLLRCKYSSILKYVPALYEKVGQMG